MLNRTAVGALSLSAAAMGGWSFPAQAQVAIRFERIGAANSFSSPTGLAQPPGERRRLYIIEQAGRIKWVRDGIPQPTPLVTLTGLVAGGESGLLGIAFHPQFQDNGSVYLLFTTSVAPAGTRIMRYTMDPANPETFDVTTAFPIMTIPRSPQTNHQGGWIGFGPEGYLYISSGDAGGGANQAQATTSLLGKMVRIDVNLNGFPNDPQANYSIPETNPLYGQVGERQEVWAMGLRNPWRCSFDRVTGDLWIADVGSGSREEVNFQPAAITPPFALHNYGWPCWEGTVQWSSWCPPPLTAPVYDYGRNLGFSVIGGYVYRGAAMPALRGTYIFGDLSRRIFRFRYDAVGGISELANFIDPQVGSIYALGEDDTGELYILTGSSGVFKIVPQCWANCDGSTTQPVLDVADFTCFIERFAAGDPYANCDGSTVEPVLNVEDFLCFVAAVAEGCV
jgi:glucose/arabinose dehydrogenase